MFLIILTFITALAISGVAIYYSILGLAAIFAAAAVPIMIMGTVLEVGKLVTASWLYQNWKQVPWFLKSYLTVAVVVLMFITSMGIFGFLSKAHVEQTSAESNVGNQVDVIDEKIIRSENKISRWTKEIDNLNSQGGSGAEVRVDELIQIEQGNLNDLYSRITDEKNTVNQQSSISIKNLQNELNVIYERIATEKKDFLLNVESIKQSIKDNATEQITLLKENTEAQIQLQNDRLQQAMERKDEDIAQTNRMRDKRQISKKDYNVKILEIEENEISVASAVQLEILTLNEKMTQRINSINEAMKKELEAVITTNDVDTKYQTQVDALQSQIAQEQKALDNKLTAVDTKYETQIESINARISELRTQSTNKTEDIDVRITELEVLIDAEQIKIDVQNEEKIIIMTKLAKLEADVGPLKYIAEFIYGQDADKNLLEEAVRWVIITIIFVFDPLAVLLLIAANFSLKQRYGWDFETFSERNNQNKKDPEVQKPTGLKVGTAIISSRKREPQVVVKEVESNLDVNKPSDVKDLEKKVKNKIDGIGNSNSSFLDE